MRSVAEDQRELRNLRAQFITTQLDKQRYGDAKKRPKVQRKRKVGNYSFAIGLHSTKLLKLSADAIAWCSAGCQQSARNATSTSRSNARAVPAVAAHRFWWQCRVVRPRILLCEWSTFQLCISTPSLCLFLLTSLQRYQHMAVYSKQRISRFTMNSSSRRITYSTTLPSRCMRRIMTSWRDQQTAQTLRNTCACSISPSTHYDVMCATSCSPCAYLIGVQGECVATASRVPGVPQQMPTQRAISIMRASHTLLLSCPEVRSFPSCLVIGSL